MKFYHYPHCPFCQRVRLALAYKGVEYEDIVLSYADVETPTNLVGAKMLPIIDFGDGTVMPESLDLVAELEKRFPEPALYFADTSEDLAWASRAIMSIPGWFDVALPYYLDAYAAHAEFDEAGTAYFKDGKEAKRGVTFEQLKAAAPERYKQSIEAPLRAIAEKLNEGFVGEAFSAADCVLAADMFGMSLVPGVELPAGIESYLKSVEEVCGETLL